MKGFTKAQWIGVVLFLFGLTLGTAGLCFAVYSRYDASEIERIGLANAVVATAENSPYLIGTPIVFILIGIEFLVVGRSKH